MRTFVITSFLLLLASCATDDPTGLHRTIGDLRLPKKGDTPYRVLIVSEPPGARIEIEGDYIGDAPQEVTLYGDANRLSTVYVKINAIPSENGQFVQHKVIKQYELVPHRILFSMGLGPPTPEVDVNVR